MSRLIPGMIETHQLRGNRFPYVVPYEKDKDGKLHRVAEQHLKTYQNLPEPTKEG